MKPPIRLKWFISLVLLSLGTILVIGYSLLSANYFILGMDNMIASNMEHKISQYHLVIPEAQFKQSDKHHDYFISRSWQQQPQNIRKVFQHAPEENRVLHKKVENIDESGVFGDILFAMRWDLDEETLFISHFLSRETTSSMVHKNITRSLQSLIAISILSVISLAIVFWLVLRQVSRPVAALGQWTRDLNPSMLHQPIPDFSYSELNELADLIHSSLSSVQESLDREHRFLRHTSHELRTPISVIRSNIDLIHKIQDCDQSTVDPKQQQILDRIDRASMTMKNLTETLLWLSRDENDKLPQQTVELDKLIQQLVEDTKYLLKDKDVDISLQTTPYSIILPEVATRIVLSNLIRNAFQHTSKGKVKIYQQDDHVKIHNTQSEISDGDEDLGFGLGLQLTSQLTSRLHWSYKNTNSPEGNIATITFKTPPQNTSENIIENTV